MATVDKPNDDAEDDADDVVESFVISSMARTTKPFNRMLVEIVPRCLDAIKIQVVIFYSDQN